MKFNKAEQVDQVCYQMRLGDYPRGLNRARINGLFNGAPPEDDDDGTKAVNVNFLEGTRLAHDARSQFYQNFLKPGNFFTDRTDSGSAQKRKEYSSISSQEMNKVMKRSIPYTECFRSKFALNVLHGIAPAAWKDRERWRPEAIGIEDVFVPANVLLTLDNLPFFCIRRSFTAPELIRLTRGKNVDPAWNKPMVEACIKWVDSQATSLMQSNWPEVWSPEKVQERIKGDGGFYVGDAVPTIDVFDFYFWSDEGKVQGWRRRMILDAWSNPMSSGGGPAIMGRKQGDVFKNYATQFLYNPGERIFASSRESIINWQFADLSAVAPFRYHSVRSLGFLLYSICHLQNRMRSRFSAAVFEQLLVYFRVKSQEDFERALKVDLTDRAVIDDSIDFIKAGDRYQVNAQLAGMGLTENANLIAQNSSSYTTNASNGARGNVEKTKFEVMSEVNAMTSLVSAALTQAYIYQVPEYREIARRFRIKDSRDPEVRQYQSNCLRRGIPEKILYNPECWDQEPERVLGSGNKTMEMAIAQQLMEYRNLYDPGAQREILRDVTLAITDDPDLTNLLVPTDQFQVTNSVHDAQLAVGTLMHGLPVAPKDGLNQIEYVDTLMATLVMLVQRGPKNMEDVQGTANMANHIGEHIGLIAQDKNEKERVKRYTDQLSQITNIIKQQAKAMSEAQQQQEGQQGGPDAETQAKIQTMMLQAQTKAKNTSDAHAQRTAQRQIQFELQQQQAQQRAEFDLQKQRAESQIQLQAKAADAAISTRKKANQKSPESND